MHGIICVGLWGGRTCGCGDESSPRTGPTALYSQRREGDASGDDEGVFHQAAASLTHLLHGALARVQREVGERHCRSNRNSCACRLATAGCQAAPAMPPLATRATNPRNTVRSGADFILSPASSPAPMASAPNLNMGRFKSARVRGVDLPSCRAADSVAMGVMERALATAPMSADQSKAGVFMGVRPLVDSETEGTILTHLELAG